MKKNDKGEMYEYCMKQSCCKVCPKLERCPFEENNRSKQNKKLSNTRLQKWEKHIPEKRI
jgi:hypothetical protein